MPTSTPHRPLTFNGVTNAITGPGYLAEVSYGTREGVQVVVDFRDETPARRDAQDVGVYLMRQGVRTRLSLSPAEQTRILTLAGALQQGYVVVDAQTTNGVSSETRIRMPLDIRVVDVNRDGDFTAQDVLHAISQTSAARVTQR